MTNMKRWSDAKLDKEVAFAPMSDDSPEGRAWIAAVMAEAHRRKEGRDVA